MQGKDNRIKYKQLNKREINIMTTTKMTGKQIFNTVLKANYEVKSIRKNKDGDVVVKLDNKGEITTMCDVKTTRQLMKTSKAHQLKAQVAWTQMNNFKQIRRTSDLPTTESAIFLVKEFIQKTRIFVERLITIHGESIEYAVNLGNSIIAGDSIDIIQNDQTYLKEILTLQSRIGGLVDL
jgi:hypothetical protein